ncbi:alpha/beta hydrolase [Pedobacter panaciterrae]|uniref:alpha/beta hydrolase n=1 Tax=Pedobacter panaciterrae TaxID=363849 RepID=UPI00155DC802|nr:alpha/beta hydrolase [Pedobacter panaciterrae]NQX54049.1 alpha/beta hydrolase [Pedobacter panaciterrae]
MKTIESKTILLVTGCFVSYIGWNTWKTYFESKGYTVIAPPWPNKEASPSVLRARHPDPAIAGLNLKKLVDHHAELISKLPEKPIIIGHSFGGLITQLLVQRGLAAAAVAYHSVAPQGVLSFKWSFIRSVTPALGLFTSRNTTYLMSFKHWQYTFTNGMLLNEQQETYNRLVVPESKNVSWDGLGKHARVDFKRPHAPLLFVSGTDDHIMPASLNYDNYKKYKDKGSVTDYKEFPGRNHLAMGQPTWQQDADYILDWLNNQ